MTDTADRPFITHPIQEADVQAGFRCQKRALNDYFARHAWSNDQAGMGRAYVLRAGESDGPEVPRVLGFYTLSMANVAADSLASVLKAKLPRYPMPVALIGRLARHENAPPGRRLGEQLLMDALRRILAAAGLVGCVGVIVDAKDEDAESFYKKYDFETVQPEGWPRRMFLPIQAVKDAFYESPHP